MDSGVGELGGGIVGAGASEAGACEITRLLLSEIFWTFAKKCQDATLTRCPAPYPFAFCS
jgi:hypothetical protein